MDAGRVPRARAAGTSPTLEDLVNAFLMTKAVMRDGGKLAPHTWNSYADIRDELIVAFGKDRLLTDLRPRRFREAAGRLGGALLTASSVACFIPDLKIHIRRKRAKRRYGIGPR